MNNDLEKFYNRWQTLKPKERNELDRETAIETSEKMKEWREQWDELEKRTVSILNDCESFGIEWPHFSFYDDLKNDLVKQEQAWKIYDDFNAELNAMGQEDWISFSRGKGIYNFQDMLHKWMETIKKKDMTVVSRYLLKLIQDYNDSFPLLKICVGEAFEKEHWSQLFFILKLPREVRQENLKF